MRDENKVIALIDGEHYLPVIADALADIKDTKEYDLAAAIFVGGTEKLIDDDDLSMLDVTVLSGDDPEELLAEAIKSYNAGLIIDLSDEPVVGYHERFRLANIALYLGAEYRGADFCFRPPVLEKILIKPSMAIIGTGKRVGKTAVSAFAARVLEERTQLAPCVVAMGRGGPAVPEILLGRQVKLDAPTLLRDSKEGKHAASDYYEDALLSRITTIGCRRCGGGLAGQPYISNVAAGAELANSVETGFVIMEGSGSAIPPVAVDGSVLVAGATQPLEYISSYFGPYKIMRSDVIVLTMCEEPIASQRKVTELEEAARKWNPNTEIVKTIFRPRPIEDISGAKVFLAMTGSAEALEISSGYLEQNFGCEVVGRSAHLSNRVLLREDMAASGGYDVLVTEIKAAAIDIVTDVGLARGLRVVYTDNIPITVGGGNSLEDVIIEFTSRIVKRHEERR